MSRKRLAKIGFVSSFDNLSVAHGHNLISVANAFDTVKEERSKK